MKILLAIDSFHHSEVAVDEVARRPWPKGTIIRVLSVAQAMPLGVVGLPATYFQDLTNSISNSARAAVDRATAKLIKQCGESIDVYGKVVSGSPKHIIVEEAERWGADLIVIGADDHGAIGHLLTNSVSQWVSTHANCSVELVRRRNTRSAVA
jgi:nucleotide-binding universal stress UspA family protein